MFSTARWRLMLWFAAGLALILVVIGAAVYLTTRAVLFDQVNDDLRSRAGREQQLLVGRLLGRPPNDPLRDVPIGPAFTAGGFFYALVRPDGELLAATANVDPAGLAAPEALGDALRDGAAFTDTESSTGDSLRVYVTPLRVRQNTRLLMEVGRSIEPEMRALRRLLLILAAGGGGGTLLALAGGFILAGRALRPIQTAMGRQRAFVADASHELRTPLSLIRANAELVKRHPDETVEGSITSIDDIIAETDRLNGLVGQMLTLAGADAGQVPLSMAELDLAHLVGDAVRQMRLLAEPKRITIDFPADGPLPVTGDATRLRELVMILLDNAVKYSDPASAVRVRLQPEAGRARLQIADNGPGIPAEALPHIFDRFYRVDKARSREMGGTGLGLAIAKWIVDGHGGDIRVDSAPGAGTTVTVELPLRPRS